MPRSVSEHNIYPGPLLMKHPAHFKDIAGRCKALEAEKADLLTANNNANNLLKERLAEIDTLKSSLYSLGSEMDMEKDKLGIMSLENISLRVENRTQAEKISAYVNELSEKEKRFVDRYEEVRITSLAEVESLRGELNRSQQSLMEKDMLLLEANR